MTTVFLFADTHINSKVALCPPGFVFDDGDSYNLSDLQRWMWDKWLATLNHLDEHRDGNVVGVLNGDAVEMDTKGRSNQIFTRNINDVVGMAAMTLEPLVQMCHSFYMVRGTEAHTGQQGVAEEMLAEDIAAVPGENGNRSQYGLITCWDGVRFDIAHHIIGGNGRPQNVQAVTDRLAADTLFSYANRGMQPPHLVIRAHIHRYFDSHTHFWTRGIVLPAWQAATSYVHAIAPNQPTTVGAVLIYLDGQGHFEVEPILHHKTH